MPRDFGFNDAILNLIGHAEAVATADAIGFKQKIDGRIELLAVERHRRALFKANDDLLRAGSRHRRARTPCP